MNEPVAVTLLVTSTLDSLEIPYLIGGSFASTAYGRVRTTQDVDIVAAMTQNKVDAFIDSLNGAFYVDEAMIRDAISRRTSFNLIHFETMFKVDIFIPQDRPFDRQQFKRRIKRVIDRDSASEAYFATPEDTVLAKLEWFRLGGEESEVQWRDIQSILQQRLEQLDLEYLRSNAAAMGLNDLLDQALAEVP